VSFLDAPTGWRRLDARMLLVHPVHELIRAIPWLFGLLVAGSSNGNGGRWGLAGLAFVIVAGMVRWFTTSYRVTPEHVQLRSGLVRRRQRAVALDRVRTVDVTANAMHRLLGLRRVTIGTGRSDRGADAGLRLDGLDAAGATRLRDELLHGRAGLPVGAAATEAGAAGADVATEEAELARLRPPWIAYGPCTLSGLLSFGLALGFVVNAANDAHVDLAHLGPLRAAADALGALGPALAVALLLAGVVLAAALFSAAGYVVAFWGFRLTRRPEGTLHVVRGLITTRAVTIEERRLRGVELAEPLLLRAARGARCAAIATGLRAGRGPERGGSVLLPPAPRAEAERVAAAVLRTSEPLACPLADHGPRARRRRYTRALVPAVVLAAAGAAVTAALGAPATVAALWLLALPVAAALAADRARGLGHAVTAGALVARAGSLVRRRAMLAREGIIGVNVRRTFFQRRAGLVTLTATTAAGDQAYAVLDVTPAEAVRVAEAAAPGLLAPFLEPPRGGTPARAASRARPRSGR
jgi:putative membrane protein